MIELSIYSLYETIMFLVNGNEIFKEFFQLFKDRYDDYEKEMKESRFDIKIVSRLNSSCEK